MGKHSRQEFTPQSPREALNEAYDRRQEALDALNRDFDAAVIDFDAMDDPKMGLSGVEYIRNKTDAALKAFDDDFTAFAKLTISINKPTAAVTETNGDEIDPTITPEAEKSHGVTGAPGEVGTTSTTSEERPTDTESEVAAEVDEGETEEGFKHPEVVKYVDGTSAWVFRTEGDKITWGDECVWADMSDSQNIAIVRIADDAVILNNGLAITSNGEAYAVDTIPEVTIGSFWKLDNTPIEADKVDAVILEGTYRTDENGQALDHSSPLFSYAKERIVRARNHLYPKRRPSSIGGVALRGGARWLRSSKK